MKTKYRNLAIYISLFFFGSLLAIETDQIHFIFKIKKFASEKEKEEKKARWSPPHPAHAHVCEKPVRSRTLLSAVGM